jgi:predicted amidophosphoribosyltransferase
VLGLLLPIVCPGCGAAVAAVCPRCTARLPRPARAPAPPGLDGWAAPFAYQGVARELVARVKYRNQRQAVAWLADGLSVLLDQVSVDVVTWAPTTSEHRRRRGFDHGEVLARAVARRLGRPARGLLGRGPGPPQTGRDARHRRASPPVFSCLTSLPSGLAVLVVDDVVTTGATLRAATAALREVGARPTAACAARTPPPEAR